jgi:hypothetical protein
MTATVMISYRPEAENPPRDASFAVTFFDNGTKSFQSYAFEPGLNKDFPAEAWSRLQEVEQVKGLISIGALEAVEQLEEVPAEMPSEIGTLAMTRVQQIVEVCHDRNLLMRWYEADKRVRVRNLIQRRLNELSDGRG